MLHRWTFPIGYFASPPVNLRFDLVGDDKLQLFLQKPIFASISIPTKQDSFSSLRDAKWHQQNENCFHKRERIKES